jgi:hypothetical protein
MKIVWTVSALFCFGIAGWGQDAISVPLPGTEVKAGQLILDGDILLGSNLARDFTLIGLQGQGMYAFDDKFAVDGKFGFFHDLSDSVEYSMYQFGADIVYQLLEMTKSGSPNQPALSLYGGVGIAMVDYQKGAVDISDGIGYFEFGFQADLIPTGPFTLQPQAGLMVVFGEDHDLILLAGLKGEHKLSGAVHLEAGLTFQSDGFSTAILFLFGLTFHPGGGEPEAKK